ncbi:MAG: hypothetical protein M1833_003288 [Piccolia ochrophora]|nr:MAG: hypothetical protein M1833_003288 [Piccolia ochrophora]
MDTLTLKARQPAEEIENWDDDEDLQGDDFQFRSTSIATNTTTTSSHPHLQRESISSRLSLRSDRDSNAGGEEERQVLLPGDDEDSTMDAIASANRAGIPIPTNVPSSALLGGTIKRLGGKKLRKIIQDDWSEDVDFPTSDLGGLKIQRHKEIDFPDSIRHSSAESNDAVGSEFPPERMSFAARMGLQKTDASVGSLNKFRDNPQDADDFFGDGDDVPTIKVAKNRSPRKPMDFSPPQATSSKDIANDDFERDLEFPPNGEPLKLSTRRDIPKTPLSHQDEFEEWAEGSLGTRYGGTRRDGVSNRSSSLSAMSPSVSSSFTAESEDEGLEGLVLPEGPLHFDDILKKRQQNASPDPANYSGEQHLAKRVAAKEDFFSGLEIGDGDVFDSGKLTLNRNVKHRSARPTSPNRRTALTLKFTNKPQLGSSRIPRALHSHDRGGSTLEPVSESGGPMPSSRRSKSRSRGHSAQSSLSNIPTPSTPSSSRGTAPSTPSKHKELGSRISMKSLRSEPTTTGAQLLKMKRSMPSMSSNPSSPAKTSSGPYRPPSRTDGTRPAIPQRPKTPVDRSGAESSLAHSRKPPVPFLPAGMAHSKSHHVSARSGRSSRHHDTEGNSGIEHGNRPSSRIGVLSRQTLRSPSPNRRRDLAPEALAREAATKRTLTRPARRRNFGDGSELELFDDLPTSVNVESKYVKTAVGRGAPKAIRSKMAPPTQTFDRAETPLPSRAFSPTKSEFTPRFARDTNSSRIAREQRVGPSSIAPLAPVSGNWRSQLATRAPGITGAAVGLSTPPSSRGRRKHGAIQQKPHLIKPLGDTHTTPKSVKGMHYNPTLFRWEGNENALAPFDAPLPAPQSSPPPNGAIKLDAAHRPALITNINAASPTVQVVGGMVFDPQRMCWLKLSHQHPPPHGNPVSPSSATADSADDSDDPFAGLDDLQDETTSTKREPGVIGAREPGVGRSSEGPKDEWLVGEEFDVGPEFVRRQRDEEERWRRKVAAWIDVGLRIREDDDWRWAFREVAAGRN